MISSCARSGEKLSVQLQDWRSMKVGVPVVAGSLWCDGGLRVLAGGFVVTSGSLQLKLKALRKEPGKYELVDGGS